MADDEPQVDLEALQQQLASFAVDDFLVSISSTLASLAFAKLDQGDTAQAKQAIDALGSLVPHVGGPLAGDLQNALTQLQVAYAQAVSA